MDYSGDEITIEEMPQGCVISSNKGTVVVASYDDAIALLESLKLMLRTKFTEKYYVYLLKHS